MIKVTTNNGTINLVSELFLTEGQAATLEKNQKTIKKLFASFGHTVSYTEDGGIISALGKSYQGEIDIEKETKVIKNAHVSLLDTLDDMMKEKTEDTEDKDGRPVPVNTEVEDDYCQKVKELLKDKRFLLICEEDEGEGHIFGNMHPVEAGLILSTLL